MDVTPLTPHRLIRSAIDHDRPEVVQQWSDRGVWDEQAYILACRWGKLRCVRVLSRDPRLDPLRGWLPAIYEDQVAVIQWLAGARIWPPSGLALTAAVHGSYRCLHQLVEWGIAILPPNIIDWTIRIAVTHSRPVLGLVPTLDLLLQLGYEVDSERHPLDILLPAYHRQPHLRQVICWAASLHLTRPRWQEIWKDPDLPRRTRDLLRRHCPFTRDPSPHR